MNQFILVLNQLFQFCIMMIVGYIAAKTAVASKEFLDGLSKLIMRVLMPILIFANATNGTSRAQLLECYPIIFLSIGMYIGLIFLFSLVAKVAGLKGERNRVYRASMIFGNAGFIGIPILLALYPQKGGIYVTLMSIVDQTCLWTYGLQLTTPKSEKTEFRLKNFLNPALCAVGFALILLLLNIQVPLLLNAPLLTIGKASIPLSLIYLGGLLYYSDWKPVLKEKELYIGIFIKMLLFPIAYYFIASQLCHNPDMVRTMTIISSLPTMTTIAMFAQSKHNQGEYALGLVLVTTIACLATLSVLSYVIF